jgi:hypothetical protein
MSLTCWSLSSGTHFTLFRFLRPFPGTVAAAGTGVEDVDDDDAVPAAAAAAATACGGCAGDPLRAFICASRSETDSSGVTSGFVDDADPGAGAGAFLNVGNFGLGLGAEKNDESVFPSLTAGAALALAPPTAAAAAAGAALGFLTSFFTVPAAPVVEAAVAEAGLAEATACFFAGGAGFGAGSSLRFLFLTSNKTKEVIGKRLLPFYALTWSRVT